MLKTSFILFVLINISWISYLNFCILSLFFVNGPQALYVNPDCLKCISGMYSMYLLKGVFIPKLLNNLLASCSLINFDFLLSHTADFDKSIILLFFVLKTFGFLLSVFFLHLKQYDNIVL